MKRPIIGVTVDNFDGMDRYRSNMDYAAAVEQAGGLPVLLPYRVDHALVPQYVDLCDGILFTGGNDLDPALYGESQWHPKAERIDPARQSFELALIAEVEKRRLPALGVCLGSQLMNVHRGGSLVQFLPDQPRENAIEHRRVPKEDPKRHDITLVADSQLGRAIATTRISVNSFHKQGVKQIGRGLRVVATAPDGVIEAFEDPSFPLFAAVQWHPERLIDEAAHLAPFTLLVEKAKELATDEHR
jgi:putative glutamine amidotransferase